MITELKPTNLIAVEVAPDASDYRFGQTLPGGSMIWKKDVFYDTKENVWNCGNIILPEGSFKILGEVTKDKIGFDVKKLKEVPLSSKEASELLNSNDKIDFYKFLAANGLYFENPVKVSGKHIVGTINKLAHDWQSFEEKLIRGKLLILEKL